MHKPFLKAAAAADASDRAQLLDHLSAQPLLYQPGSTWDLAAWSDVLGLLVEAQTEQSLGRHLRRTSGSRSAWRTPTSCAAGKVARYAKALPVDPETGRPQTMRPLTEPKKFECGGGCTASTASDYFRFASMLPTKASVQPRVLGRKTAEFMTSTSSRPTLQIWSE